MFPPQTGNPEGSLPREQSLRSAPSGRNSEQGLAPRSKYSRRMPQNILGTARVQGDRRLRRWKRDKQEPGGQPPSDEGGVTAGDGGREILSR